MLLFPMSSVNEPLKNLESSPDTDVTFGKQKHSRQRTSFLLQAQSIGECYLGSNKGCFLIYYKHINAINTQGFRHPNIKHDRGSKFKLSKC